MVHDDEEILFTSDEEEGAGGNDMAAILGMLRGMEQRIDGNRDGTEDGELARPPPCRCRPRSGPTC